MKSRNSTIEIFRIIGVLGIIGLHIFGEIRWDISRANSFVEIFYSDIFCMAVPFFLLISGYYSVNFNYLKLGRLHSMLVFYLLIDFYVKLKTGFSVGSVDLIAALFPILSYKRWYFSCYFILVILSFWINWLADTMSQKLLFYLLLVWMLAVNTFTVLPVFSLVDDYLWKVFFYYLAGRYLKKYGLKLFDKRSSYLKCGVAFVLITYLANVILTVVYGESVSIFATDCFILKELAAIFIFYYFVDNNISDKRIDLIASFVPAVYVAEGTVRRVGEQFFSFGRLYNNVALIFFVIAYSVAIYAIIALVETLRRFVFTKIEGIYIPFKYRLYQRIYGKIVERINRKMNWPE